jgi:chromosome segregation ATPase
MALTTSKTPGQQDIEQLRKRHTELDRKKAAAEANLKTANEQLDQLKKQAREQFGTDDLEQLRAKLDEMKKENERKRAEYQKHLDEIEAGLNEVDKEFGGNK